MCSGGGHIASVLKNNGYNVLGTDIVDRGWEGTIIHDFIKDENDNWHGDIITNPPYKHAKEFVKEAMHIIDNGSKIAMFLKLTFLEGMARRTLFETYPPKTIYVYSKRAKCAMNGDFENTGSSAVCYAWFIWEKGYIGDPIIKWI